MRAAKGKAVVEQNPLVCNVRRAKRAGESLAKVLAQRQVECCVTWEMVGRGIAIGESGPVINVG